jgi:hypothetical protein
MLKKILAVALVIVMPGGFIVAAGYLFYRMKKKTH